MAKLTILICLVLTTLLRNISGTLLARFCLLEFNLNFLSVFKVGLFSGAFIVLIIAVVLSSVFYDVDPKSTEPRNDWRIPLKLYRGPFLVIIFVFLMGVNVYGWRSVVRTVVPKLFRVADHSDRNITWRTFWDQFCLTDDTFTQILHV